MKQYAFARIANTKPNFLRHAIRVSGDTNYRNVQSGKPPNRLYFNGAWLDIDDGIRSAALKHFSKMERHFGGILEEKYKKWQDYSRKRGYFDGFFGFSKEQIEALGGEFEEKIEGLVVEYVYKALDHLYDGQKYDQADVLISIHWDEETPHVHFSAPNVIYKPDKHENLAPYTVISHNAKTERLRPLQDLAGEVFGGLGFVRGIHKEQSGRTHEETSKWKARQFRKLDVDLEAKKLDIEAINGLAEAPDFAAAYEFMTSFKLKYKDLAAALKSEGLYPIFNKIQRTIGHLAEKKASLDEALAGFNGKQKEAIQILDSHINEVWAKNSSLMGHLTQNGVNELKSSLIFFAKGIAAKAEEASAVAKKELELQEREIRLKTAEHKLGAIQYQTKQLKADFDTLQAQIEAKKRELSSIDQQVRQKREAKEQKKSLDVSR